MIRRRVLSISLILLLLIQSFSLFPVLPIEAQQSQPSDRWISENTFSPSPGVLRIYGGSMAYWNSSTLSYEPVNVAIRQNSTHYYVVANNYKAFISKDLSVEYPFTIIRSTGVLRWKPINAGYIDRSSWKIQIIRSLNTSAAVTVSGNQIIYKQFFGRNIDFNITVGTDTFQEDLLISHTLITNLPNPSTYGMLPENTFVGVISNYDKINLNLTDESGSGITANFSSTDNLFLKTGSTIQLRIAPDGAWDAQVNQIGLHNNTVQVRNIFTFNNGVSKIGSGVPYNWIKNTVGTVTVDPTVSIGATDDNAIYEDTPTTNYGSQPWVGMYDYDDGAATHASMRTISTFALTSIPANSIVNSAKLGYFAYSGVNPCGVTVYTYNLTRQDWSESQSTWNIYKTANSWTTAGGDYNTVNGSSITCPNGSNVWWNFTVTNLVRTFYAKGTSAFFLSKFNTEHVLVSHLTYFRSSEYATDTTKRPFLEVSYSPLGHTLTVEVNDAGGNNLYSNTYMGYNGSNWRTVNSSGYAVFTSLADGTYRLYGVWQNSSSSNGQVTVNASNYVTVIMSGSAKSVMVLLGVYKINNIGFKTVNGSAITPSNMSFTMGNNGTTKTLTSFSGFFVSNGSQTPQRIYKWNNNIRLNTSDPLSTSTYNANFTYNVKVTNRNPYWRDFDGHNVSYSRLSGTYSVLFPNGTSKTGLSTNTVYKMQNGSSTVTNPTWQSMNVTEGTRVFNPYSYKPNFTLAIENHTRAPSDFFGVNTTALKVVLGSSPNYILKNNANISFSYSGGVVSISEGFVKPILAMTKQNQTSGNLTFTIQDSSATDQWKLIWLSGGGGGGNTTVTTTINSQYYGRETPLMLIFVLIGLTMGAVLVMQRRR